jgi:hypothetical protein
MDRVATLLRFQRRAYWRRFRRAGNMTTSNVGVLILVGGLGLVRYLQALPPAARQVANGETTRYETLLIIAFLAWLVPVMAESRRSISSRDLLHLPLSTTELFVIRLGSVFCSPLVWITAVVSLALSYPVALAPDPLTGFMALIVYLLLGLFTSLALMHVLQSALARKLSVSVLFVVSVVTGLFWLTGKRVESLSPLTDLLPHRLASAAAVSPTPVRSLTFLVVITAVSILLARWTFVLTLEPGQNRRSQRFALFALPQLPGKFGGLLRKDLRYWSRLLDLYLALPIVVLFNIYLAVNFAPSATALFVVIGMLFWPCASIAFNCFGLDSPLGLDRYTLFPLSEKEKLFSKNLAFWVVMTVLLFTILPFAIWTLEPSASGIAVLEFVGMGLAYAAIGNWLSVKQPFRMQFYRFASGGSVVDAIMGMLFASVPAALTVILLWKVGIVLPLYLAIYLFFLARAARVLKDQWDHLKF